MPGINVRFDHHGPSPAPRVTHGPTSDPCIPHGPIDELCVMVELVIS